MLTAGAIARDALYVNFLSGYEMCLGTAEALRHGFRRVADLRGALELPVR